MCNNPLKFLNEFVNKNYSSSPKDIPAYDIIEILNDNLI